MPGRRGSWCKSWSQPLRKRAESVSKKSARLAQTEWPQVVEKIRERTPARILVGRAGAGYTTAMQMDLRQAHAAAADAVRTELELASNLSPDFIQRWKLFEVSTCTASKSEYLLRPDLGRRLNQEACEQVRSRCAGG